TKAKLQNLPDVKIIGISGSYGKTTMKEVLKDVLCIKYNVLSTPESINTPVGIARWILKNLNDATEVAIVEMGEHYRGDVKEISEMVRPDIAVITGINESHQERMKSLSNIVGTVFEITEGLKPGGTVLVNADDKNIIDNHKKYVWPDHK